MLIDEKVTVGMVNDSPRYVIWKGRNYTVTKIGLHHTLREGKTLFHIFSVASVGAFMRLRFDTETLGWRLEEIMTDADDANGI